MGQDRLHDEPSPGLDLHFEANLAAALAKLERRQEHGTFLLLGHFWQLLHELGNAVLEGLARKPHNVDVHVCVLKVTGVLVLVSNQTRKDHAANHKEVAPVDACQCKARSPVETLKECHTVRNRGGRALVLAWHLRQHGKIRRHCLVRCWAQRLEGCELVPHAEQLHTGRQCSCELAPQHIGMPALQAAHGPAQARGLHSTGRDS
mmetsp:Transcript_53777/g.153241  ORF Transcript_53777/g.153241 Transcript_53777/m.153241 type:complete len:205 (-) Transcript_53777:1282-1896(-)